MQEGSWKEILNKLKKQTEQQVVRLSEKTEGNLNF